MLRDLGATAEPIIARRQAPRNMNLRAWKTSETEERTGPKTADERTKAFDTQIRALSVSWKLSPIQVSYLGKLGAVENTKEMATYNHWWPLKSEELSKVHKKHGEDGDVCPGMELWFLLIVIIYQVCITAGNFLDVVAALVLRRCCLFIVREGFNLLGSYKVRAHFGGALVQMTTKEDRLGESRWPGVEVEGSSFMLGLQEDKLRNGDDQKSTCYISLGLVSLTLWTQMLRVRRKISPPTGMAEQLGDRPTSCNCLGPPWGRLGPKVCGGIDSDSEKSGLRRDR